MEIQITRYEVLYFIDQRPRSDEPRLEITESLPSTKNWTQFCANFASIVAETAIDTKDEKQRGATKGPVA
jgi:hypothetical protein